MSVLRPVEERYAIDKKHWVGSGFYVSNYFPEGRNLLERFSPFALMDYNEPKDFPPAKSPRGIGAHPHRGIETVTFAFEGAVEHHDNAGNHGIIYSGGVQWMTAGGGIMHKEYHEKDFAVKGGILHMMQLWVNLPKKDKYAEPRYQDIAKSKMGKFERPSGQGEIAVVAGEYEGVKGPAKTFSPMNIYIGDIKPQGRIILREPGDYNTGILVVSGEAKINGSACAHRDFILFENKAGEILIEAANEGVRFIFLSGEPLNEPVVAGGPFVMNTREELSQAFTDYREGNFGTEDF